MRQIFCEKCVNRLIQTHAEDTLRGINRRRVWIALAREDLVCDCCCEPLKKGQRVQCDTQWLDSPISQWEHEYGEIEMLRGYPVAEAILLNHTLYEFRDDE